MSTTIPSSTAPQETRLEKATSEWSMDSVAVKYESAFPVNNYEKTTRVDGQGKEGEASISIFDRENHTLRILVDSDKDTTTGVGSGLDTDILIDTQTGKATL